jgi:hypothetical protein
MSDKKSNILAMLVCLAVVLGWFSPWWAGGRNLAPLDLLNHMMQPWRGANEHGYAKNHIVSDAVDQYLVYRLAAEKSYHEEGWLGWSSLTYGGTAQYANTMALYYDWTMQLHRWLPFWTAWHVGLICQALIASWGMFWFLRGRGIGALWSCCGGLAYAANSQFVTWIYHRWALSAFCWVPWMLWSIDRARRGGHLAWACVPIFLAMAMLGGTLQHGALVGLVLFAAWAEDAWKCEHRISPQIRLLGRYAGWGVLGIGLAAMMILPCAAALLESNRLGLHTAASMGVYPEGWLQPLYNLAAYPLQVFPSVLGSCESFDLLKLFRSQLLYVAYFGSLPVLIAYLCCFRKETPLLARLLMGIGLLLPLTPAVKYLYQRLFLLFIFGGIYAFAHFMESSADETRRKVCGVAARVSCLVVLVWLVASVVLTSFRAKIEALVQARVMDSGGGSFGYFKDWMHGRLLKFLGDLPIWSQQQLLPLGLFLLGLAGLWWTAHVSSRRRNAGAWMLAGVVVLEVTLFASRWVTWTDPARCPLYAVTPEVEVLRKQVGDQGRVAILMADASVHMAVTPFALNTLGPYGIATIQGYDSIVPQGMSQVADKTMDAGVLGHLAVSHLITYHGNAPTGRGWDKVWESPFMALFANGRSVPRYIGFRSDGDKDLFFQDESPGQCFPIMENTHKENTRRMEVPARTTWLRVAENAATGWEYRIQPSGEWNAVSRAPDTTMLLSLGDAARTKPVDVEMRYAPPWREGGFSVSGISLLLTIVVAGTLALRRPVA